MKSNITFIVVTVCALIVMGVIFKSINDLTQSYMHEEQMSVLAANSSSHTLPSL